MTASIRDNTKKRGRPVTTGKGQLIGVRLLPPVLDPLDTWIAAQPDPKPSRPEAIRHALTDWLTSQGYVRNDQDPEGGEPRSFTEHLKAKGYLK